MSPRINIGNLYQKPEKKNYEEQNVLKLDIILLQIKNNNQITIYFNKHKLQNVLGNYKK